MPRKVQHLVLFMPNFMLILKLLRLCFVIVTMEPFGIEDFKALPSPTRLHMHSSSQSVQDTCTL